MLISTICPDCQSKLNIPAQRAGQTIPCPRCGRKITLAPAPPPIPPHFQPPPLSPIGEEEIQPSAIEAEIPHPQESELGLSQKRQLWVGILAAILTFVLVIGGLWAFGLFPRHSSKLESLETQARKALIKALDSWRFGDKVTKVRKENIHFFDYDRIFCNAKLVRFEIGNIRNQHDGYEIATHLIFEGRKRNEIKESKVYLVKQVDDRWQIVALNDDTQEKLDDWLETMKARAEAVFQEKGGEEEPGRKTAVAEKYQDLVASKKSDLQDLNGEEDDPDIKKLLQKWILPIADIESPTAKRQPAYWVKALGEGEPKWSKAVEVLVGMGEMAVGELSAGLKDRDPLVRWGSATALGEIGPPAARKALASLIESLGDANGQVLKATQIALNKIGPPTREEIPTYQRILNHPKEAVRLHALTALANLNLEMPELIPAFIEALKDSAKAVRILAAQCLGNFGGSAKEVTFAPLFAALKDADLEVRHQASEALKKIGPPRPADVPTLGAALNDPNEEVRQYALFALEQLGPQAKEVLPSLIAALQEKTTMHRLDMVVVIGKIGPEAGTAVPVLVQGFRDPNEEYRNQCGLAVARIGAAAVPVLQNALRDGDGNVRSLAASALGEIGLPAKPAIPALVEVLKDSVPQVRAKAAAALGKMAEEARLALPVLDQTLKDKDREVRLQTVKALTRIGPVSILLQGLIDTWEEDDPELNQAAEAALNKMGVLGDKTVPILRKALGSSRIPVRLYAAKTLGDIGPAARDAVPELNNALRDTDMGVRLQVTLALSKIGPGTGSANPLVPALLDKDTEVSAKALSGLGNVERFAKADVPALLQAVQSDKPAVRAFAAAALGKIGPEGKDAVPALRKTLTDADEKVRRASATALGKIGPSAWSAAPDLATALKDRDIQVRKNAIAAVAAIGAGAQLAFAFLVQAMKDNNVQEDAFNGLVQIGKPAVPDLVKALDEKSDYNFRLRVIKVLGKIGPDAKDAIDALTALSTLDKYATVRQAAREALGKIQKKP